MDRHESYQYEVTTDKDIQTQEQLVSTKNELNTLSKQQLSTEEVRALNNAHADVAEVLEQFDDQDDAFADAREAAFATS
ncbi:MAG: hypothetical protein H6765_08025 [Candidatus Peribacteria bacterium]|nr:MAG: hypothetical protein H6765_08025 [Candidatus Peribacteria bacterium]